MARAQAGSAGAPDPASTRAARSTAYPALVQRLIDELARLPGVGPRSAERLALHLLKSDQAVAQALAAAITDVKRAVRNCELCFNLADGPRCAVCADPRRDHACLLVVEQPRDLLAIEQTGMYRGAYHVLLGRLSPLEGVGPADLTIADLVRRVRQAGANGGVQVREVILGLNPTLEGDGTTLYLSGLLKDLPVRVSRLARGLPSGSSMEFASKAVLADAIEGRQEFR
ncbi:MAG: recombination protein RecR [Phycisphaerae bacterium]|nr:recombination protein RecR [Phycisphaerae bacterium]